MTGPQKKQEMRMRIFRYVRFLPFVAILIALILFGAIQNLFGPWRGNLV